MTQNAQNKGLLALNENQIKFPHHQRLIRLPQRNQPPNLLQKPLQNQQAPL